MAHCATNFTPITRPRCTDKKSKVLRRCLKAAAPARQIVSRISSKHEGVPSPPCCSGTNDHVYGAEANLLKAEIAPLREAKTGYGTVRRRWQRLGGEDAPHPLTGPLRITSASLSQKEATKAYNSDPLGGKKNVTAKGLGTNVIPITSSACRFVDATLWPCHWTFTLIFSVVFVSSEYHEARVRDRFA
ncbi:hypothetical protein PAXINDRAFT_20667 [Paxillus involutus ATCC 200175]|uniref:Unplaced genomic scaffold PAXINscaffold_1178, whole genome shotgun sequence n=1 Tax=Paxillus involutus ATCC 200175 TaxID=664439 RepID=A0A0C9SUK5_PAXIN|nr:hypothetical protein PAXINDRAFT_20667 [Paxillus involutus ATCC 200175]